MQEKTLQNGKFYGFADRLKSLTNRSVLPQRDIAKAVGMSGAALSRYLDGQIPKAERLFSLAEFFGVSMEWLLIGKDVPGSARVKESQTRADVEGERRHAEKVVAALEDLKRLLNERPPISRKKAIDYKK